MQTTTVNIIGSGNVAFHLVQHLVNIKSVRIQKIYARNPKAFQQLFDFHLPITNDISSLHPADITILTVSDSSIEEVSQQIPYSNQLVVHTSGTTSFEKIDNKNKRGVLYPLQTFSKTKKNLDFSKIPLCLETEFEKDFVSVQNFANKLSNNIYKISEEQRKHLHLSAVFVCNFTNHLYALGEDICKKNQIPFEILQPLIIETAEKIKNLPPNEAQTGPAIRKDTQTIEKHLELISDSATKEIYALLTNSIQKYNGKKL